jgi:hypothetical protein
MVLVLYNSKPSAGVQALSQQLQDKQISKKKKKKYKSSIPTSFNKIKQSN